MDTRYPLRSRTLRVVAMITLVAAGCALPVHAAGPADGLVGEGDRLWAASQLDGAESAFLRAVEASPNATEPLMKLGGLRLSRQKFADAIPTYQRAIGLEPQLARAWIGLGFAYLHLGQADLARNAFDEAGRIDPSKAKQLAALLPERKTP